MPIETELKLYIAPEDTDKFVQHPLLQSAVSQKASQHLHSTYFDTPEYNLLQQGVGLRVRRIGDRRVQTIKTAGKGLGGLHQRQEWETDITGEVPDYNQFPQGVLPEWCADQQNLSKIQALFTTEFMRTTWHLLSDGNEVEVALDQGEIKTDTARHTLSEVELELKSGTPDHLYLMALTLHDVVPLRIENKSKAALGYELYKPEPLQFYKAGAVDLNSAMTAEQAFIHILWHCLRHLQANEEMVLHGSDIEGVHQMRVALRRLRSCLSLYKPLIPKKIYANLRDDIKWITAILGVARDWDVFALSLQEIHSQDHNSSLSAFLREELEKLQRQVTEFQAQAYVNVRDALRSPRYTRLLLQLGKWLTQHGWRQQLKTEILQRLDSPVSEFANQILDSHYQRVCQQGTDLTQLTPKQLHNLRISIKKLAYGTRFFNALYPHEIVRPYAKNLSHLQDELGILNDGNVASDLLNQAGLDENAPIGYFLNGWYAHQRITHLAGLDSTWQVFLGQQIFWLPKNPKTGEITNV